MRAAILFICENFTLWRLSKSGDGLSVLLGRAGVEPETLGDCCDCFTVAFGSSDLDGTIGWRDKGTLTIEIPCHDCCLQLERLHGLADGDFGRAAKCSDDVKECTIWFASNEVGRGEAGTLVPIKEFVGSRRHVEEGD